MRFDLEEGSYFAGGGVHFDHEEGIILSLDKGYILISRGLGNGWSYVAVADRCRLCLL